MSYDLLRFSLLFRRFVNVKADSELLCALFRESSCTSIHLFRAPPQSNQTHKTNTAPIGANQPKPKNKIHAFLCGFLRLPTQHSTPEDRPFKTKPLLCGFYRPSDRLLGRLLLRLIDSHHFSENAQVQIVRVSRRPLPSTPKYLSLDTLTPEYARFLAP